MAPSTAMLMAPDDSQSRPASAAVHSHSTSSGSTSRRQQRASHTVVSPTQQREEDQQPVIPDVYSHRAAVAYAAAHPRRTIPKFGPYLLLQTLGEGEFGKVKLGLHSQWGEEVAVKLIRRGHVDITAVRMGKVEREIEVLRTLKHPNIVRLYDVIETDKYIGIILEYAAGGELFDYILAHRFLKEPDAARLFAQLISGVWYIHQKKIVHRDLKLENLLLDRHRNVIITDFGFANRFEHRADDLMQTSCGSPCYAAPELVISEGLYVGSAVDVWSCGVILYAMLAGYLPFDDDPANPDGDNINLLYKYIVNTPLTFPDYISNSARDLLGIMLVPDPKHRATLPTIMRHPWLSAHAGKIPEFEGISTEDGGVAFGNSVEDLERAAMEQHQQRRLAYQKQMRAQAQESQVQSKPQPAAKTVHMSMQVQPPSRSHSTRVANYTTSAVDSRTASAQPEYLYETSNPADQSISSVYPVVTPKKGHSPGAVPNNNSNVNNSVGMDMDDLFSIPGSIPQSTPAKRQREGKDGEGEKKPRRDEPATEPTALSPESPKSKKGEFRHTIQVEYDSQVSPSSREKRGEKSTTSDSQATITKGPSPPRLVQNGVPVRPALPEPPSVPRVTPERRHSQKEKGKEPVTPLRQERPAPRPIEPQPASAPAPAPAPPSVRVPPPPVSAPPPPLPIVNINPASPPATPSHADGFDVERRTSKHRKGTGSIGGGLGFGRIFGNGGGDKVEPKVESAASSRVPSESSARDQQLAMQNGNGSVGKMSGLQPPSVHSNSSKEANGVEKSAKDQKKNRRNTLTVIVDPFGFGKSSKNKSKGAAARANTLKEEPPQNGLADESFVSVQGELQSSVPQTPVRNPPPQHSSSKALPGSTSKANRVMQWFRAKSKSIAVTPPVSETRVSPLAPPSEIVATPSSGSRRTIPTPVSKPTAPSITYEPSTPTVFSRIRNSVTVASTPPNGRDRDQAGVPPEKRMRFHHGAVDQTMVTTAQPLVVLDHVKSVLQDMGVEVQLESEFKYRCVRVKRRRVDANGDGAFIAAGGIPAYGLDRRGLPVPSSFHGTGGMLRGLLMRRQSSQVSGGSQPSLAIEDDNTPTQSPITPSGGSAAGMMTSEPSSIVVTLYGDKSEDAGDEVRFSVELTKIDRLEGTYSIDIRRLKGNLRSYKFLYDTIRHRANIPQLS